MKGSGALSWWEAHCELSATSTNWRTSTGPRGARGVISGGSIARTATRAPQARPGSQRLTEFTGIRTLSHSQEQPICLWVYARTHALTNWLCHCILTLSPRQGISRQPDHLQRLRDVPHRRRNELPMLRSLSIAPTALYKSRPKPLAHGAPARRAPCIKGLAGV